MSCFLLSSIVGHSSYVIFGNELSKDTFEGFLNSSLIKSQLLYGNNIIMGSKVSLENWGVGLIGSFIYSTISGTLIFLAIFKYVRYIKSVASHMSVTTKKLHTEFLKIVVLQSCVPFLLTLPCVMIYSIFALTGNIQKIYFLGDILVKCFCAIPAINPMLYIFLSKKNRIKFFSIFTNLSKLKHKILSKQSGTFIISNQMSSLENFTSRKGNRIAPFKSKILQKSRALSVAII